MSFTRLSIVVVGDNKESIIDIHDKEIWRNLADNGFIFGKSVGCVGFRRDIKNNSLVVVLPKVYANVSTRNLLSENDYCRESVYLLIRILRKIRMKTRYALSEGVTNRTTLKSIDSTDPVLDSFDAAIRLRKDYITNGAYLKKASKKVRKQDTTPVDWNLTIRRSSLISLEKNNLCFHDIYHRKRKIDFSNPLYKLHIACLEEIFHLTGDKISLNTSNTKNELLDLRRNPNRYLKNIQESVFDERGIFLVKAIKSYLGNSSLLSLDSSISEYLLSYTKDFEDIWEKILRDLFSINQLARGLPTGTWYTWPSGDRDSGIRPEMDINDKIDDMDYIIDAKDYRIISGLKWNGSSSDHYKQIIYRKLLNELPSKSTINILAFPNIGQDKLFEIRGFHKWDQIEGSEIFEITVDYVMAARKWLNEIPINVNDEIHSLLLEIASFRKRILGK